MENHACECCLLALFNTLLCCLDPKASACRSTKETTMTSRSSHSSIPSYDGTESDGFKARKFALADLVAATNNFKTANFIGEGGFGKVYKGRLPGGEVKRVM